MPKFLAGIVIVKTFETYASSDEEARGYIQKWQEGETEAPERGVKVIRYKLQWEEGVSCVTPAEERDQVLASFLELMQNKIPGMPMTEPTEPPRLYIIGQNQQPPP